MGGGPSAVQATDVQGGTNDEVQTVALSNATDGEFRLAFGRQVMPAFDATVSDLETALEDLATLLARLHAGLANGRIDANSCFAVS